MMIDIYKKNERIYIFSPSIDVDYQTWLPVKKYIENDLKLKETEDEKFYFSEYNSDALSNIIETQKKTLSTKKKKTINKYGK